MTDHSPLRVVAPYVAIGIFAATLGLFSVALDVVDPRGWQLVIIWFTTAAVVAVFGFGCVTIGRVLERLDLLDEARRG